MIRAQRWVDRGRVITSGGISAGIDMSLHLVSRLSSLSLAERTATQMAFNWVKNTSNHTGSELYESECK